MEHHPDSQSSSDAHTVSDFDDAVDDDPASEGASGAESDASYQAPYTIEELAAFFTDFYHFLANLHYDPVNLKLPPVSGWNTALLPKTVVSSKSDNVVQLMRHLPYFKGTEIPTHVH